MNYKEIKRLYRLSINELKTFGFKSLVRKSVQHINIKKMNPLLPAYKTNISESKAKRKFQLSESMKGSFILPENGICRVDILIADINQNFTGIQLTITNKNNRVIRRVNCTQIDDAGYAKFIFPTIRYSANRKFFFSFSGIKEPYPSVWYNPAISYKAVQLNDLGSTDIRIYSNKRTSNLYVRWIALNEPNDEELEHQRRQAIYKRPVVSIIVPVYNTPLLILNAMIDSVIKQTYPNWELCIADGCSKDEMIRTTISKYAEMHPNIKYVFLDHNEGIVGNTNAAAELATGEYVAFLDHDDTLAPFALYEIVMAINEHDDVDFIYSDEDMLSEDGFNRFDPYFKSDWSPDTLRSYNYITHLSTYSSKLFHDIGRLRSGYEGSQDYDLILRATEKARRIVHIPKVLYHWRVSANSSAQNAQSKLYAYDSAKKALQDHLMRLGLNGAVSDGLVISTYKISYEIIDKPLISIIIPNKDNANDLERCVNSIFGSSYENYEIIIVENNSTKKETFTLYEQLGKDTRVKVICWNNAFNYSAINNYAVKFANGSMLLFLNNDTEMINRDCIERMLEHAQRPDIGGVGAKLYYPDNTIQHGGVIVGLGGVAGHAHRSYKATDEGYYYKLMIVQNQGAVTAACLMMRKSVFYEIGCFDESIAVAFNDVDLCLKARKAGYLIIWTPYAELYHFESKTRGNEDTVEKMNRFDGEVKLMHQKWGDVIVDPYYNPNLTLVKEDYSIRY